MDQLSRPARLALTLFISAAIILPLAILVPRYLNWQIASRERALFIGNTAATLTP